MIDRNNLPTFVFYFGIAAFLLYMFYKSCGDNNDYSPQSVQEIIKTVTTVDTVFFPKEKKIIVNIPVNHFDTVYIDSSRFHRLYKSDFSDSLIDARMENEVDGTLISSKLFYVPKFPKYILRTDSVYSTAYIPVGHKPRSYVFGGLSLHGNRENFGFGALIGYNYRGISDVGYGYDIINNRHQIFFTRRISLKKEY